MPVINFLPVHVVKVEIFYRKSENFELLVALEEEEEEEMKSNHHQSRQDSSSGDHECLY